MSQHSPASMSLEILFSGQGSSCTIYSESWGETLISPYSCSGKHPSVSLSYCARHDLVSNTITPVCTRDEAAVVSPAEPADYPRPSAPGTELNTEHARNDEEAPPKKERRKSHGAHENERRLRENPQRRVDENWQRREQSGTPKTNARISQPGGKVSV